MERLVAFVIVSIILSLGRKVFKFTIKLLVIGLVLIGTFIYRETIIDFIKGLGFFGDRISFMFSNLV